MKKILLLTLGFFIFSTQIYAQTFTTKGPLNMPYNSDTQEFQYSETIKVDSLAARALLIRATRWFDSFYKNPSSVIKAKTDSSIMGKYQFNLFKDASGTRNVAGLIHYTLTITVRDGEYSYNITRINLKSQSYFGIEKWLSPKNKKEEEYFADNFKQVADHFRKLLDHLKESMDTSEKAKIKPVSLD